MLSSSQADGRRYCPHIFTPLSFSYTHSLRYIWASSSSLASPCCPSPVPSSSLLSPNCSFSKCQSRVRGKIVVVFGAPRVVIDALSVSVKSSSSTLVDSYVFLFLSILSQGALWIHGYCQMLNNYYFCFN